MPLDEEVVILYAVISGYLDDVPVDRVAAFGSNLHRFMATRHPEIGQRIAVERELKGKLRNLSKQFSWNLNRLKYTEDIST
jgi:F-type H+-transporting ATPase subunit alpha